MAPIAFALFVAATLVTIVPPVVARWGGSVISAGPSPSLRPSPQGADVALAPGAISPVPYWYPTVSQGSPGPFGIRGGGSVGFAYDAGDGYDVLVKDVSYGPNGPSAETWVFSNGQWLNQTSTAGGAPTVRAEAPMIYDPAEQAVVFLDANSVTWTYSRGTWTQLGAAGPPGGEYSFAYDSQDGYAILFGGPNVQYGYKGFNSYYQNLTWSYLHGTWRNLTPALSISPPRGVGCSEMAYDAASSAIVMFGAGWRTGSLPTSFPIETWEFQGGSWLNRTANAGSPPGQSCSVFTYDPRDGFSVYGAGTAYQGQANGTWGWESGQWVLLATFAPPVAAPHAHEPLNQWLVDRAEALDPATQRPLLLETDANGTHFLFDFVLGVPPGAPTIDSFVAQPGTEYLGASVTFHVSASGGYFSSNLTYSSLPPGCVSANRTSLTCAPTASGSYRVTVSAVDLLGRSGSRTVTLTVLSSLEVALLGGTIVAGSIFLALGVVRLYRRRRRGNSKTETPMVSDPPRSE